MSNVYVLPSVIAIFLELEEIKENSRGPGYWKLNTALLAIPVRFPFKPEFFQVSSFQPLRLKHFHCDDLHIILSLSAVQIYEFHILMFIYSPSTG